MPGASSADIFHRMYNMKRPIAGSSFASCWSDVRRRSRISGQPCWTCWTVPGPGRPWIPPPPLHQPSLGSSAPHHPARTRRTKRQKATSTLHDQAYSPGTGTVVEVTGLMNDSQTPGVWFFPPRRRLYSSTMFNLVNLYSTWGTQTDVSSKQGLGGEEMRVFW